MKAQAMEAPAATGHLPRTDPVIILSYPHSGGRHLQEILAAGNELACTSGTGIVPMCATAAQVWRRLEGRPETAKAMSRLAVSTVRGLITAQITLILAGTGRTRWCELASISAGVAEPFLQVFPHAGFVSVHRHCLEAVGVGIQASPWGLQGQGLTPYLLAWPGNNVAALAAFWADSTEELLDFERANSGSTCRIRYEDVAAEPAEALLAVRAHLGLSAPARALLPEPSGFPPPSIYAPLQEHKTVPMEAVPVAAIPAPLRERIGRLHAELGYPPLA
jgi:hypothetical protein